MFKFIDINGIKHAAEYLNSSKVKYDDDVIDRTKIMKIAKRGKSHQKKNIFFKFKRNDIAYEFFISMITVKTKAICVSG